MKLPSERVTATWTIEPFVAFQTCTRPPTTGDGSSPGVVTVPWMPPVAGARSTLIPVVAAALWTSTKLASAKLRPPAPFVV